MLGLSISTGPLGTGLVGLGRVPRGTNLQNRPQDNIHRALDISTDYLPVAGGGYSAILGTRGCEVIHR